MLGRETRDITKTLSGTWEALKEGVQMRFPGYSLSSALFFACLFLVFTADRADAYVDPGTGSYLLQCVIGALLGGAFAVKVFWGKIKAFLSRAFRGKQDRGDD